MKRIVSVILLMLLTLSFCSCGDGGGEETGPSNSEIYRQKREAFRSSEVYEKALGYVDGVFTDLVPGCTVERSLEPGDLIDSDLSEFADFDDAETRKDFFSKADLSFKVDFWNFGYEAEAFAKELTSRGISGRMAAGENSGGDCYRLDAVNGTAVFERQPEA